VMASKQTAARHIDVDCSCFQKAKAKGEQTFTLRAQDISSPITICYWILANIQTAPPHKLRCALEDALTMRDHPNRKYAD
jgi:hypothetical protein